MQEGNFLRCRRVLCSPDTSCARSGRAHKVKESKPHSAGQAAGTRSHPPPYHWWCYMGPLTFVGRQIDCARSDTNLMMGLSWWNEKYQQSGRTQEPVSITDRFHTTLSVASTADLQRYYFLLDFIPIETSEFWSQRHKTYIFTHSWRFQFFK